MGLKTIQSVSGEVSTTDDSTWVTIATFSVASNCSIRITEIFALGKTSNGTVGQHAYAEAVHRAKKVAGVLTVQGSIVFIMTFNTGSDPALNTCAMQIVASGGDLLLQVKGMPSRNIDWYGGFTVTLN
jgi:hypothetical protein